MVLGEMDVARVNPHWSGQGEPPLQLACFTTRQASSSHPTPGGGGDTRCPSYSVDDVHQARME